MKTLVFETEQIIDTFSWWKLVVIAQEDRAVYKKIENKVWEYPNFPLLCFLFNSVLAGEKILHI